MKEFYTYELIDSRNNEVFYIGKGIYSRMYAHANAVKNNRHYNNKLKNKILSIFKNDGKVLYNKIFAVDEQSAFDKEIELIKQRREEGCNLCNFTDGGEGISGHRFNKTEESKKKISDIMKDKPKSEEHKAALKKAKKDNPNNTKYWENKTFSEEHKEKLSERALKRAPMSDEHKRKISENSAQHKNKGKTHIEIYGIEVAEAARIKNRESHLGKKDTDEVKKKKSQSQLGAKHRLAKTYVINDNKNIFEEKTSKSELSRKFNISPHIITAMISKGLVYNNITIKIKNNE